MIGPLAAVVSDANGPVAGLAARLELRQLSTAVGYRVLYAPEVRALQVVDGGLVGERDGIEALVGVVSEALRSGEADVALLPPLELGSDLAVAVGSLGGAADAPAADRRLDAAPARAAGELRGVPRLRSATRPARASAATRGGSSEAFGARLTLAILREEGDLEQLVRDADRVAGSAYQRGLGAGFAATAEQRELARVGLEHGWVRGYLLYLDADPIAYWLCSVYDRTILLRTGGYDESYAAHRVGIHLLMRVIEDACADPSLDVLDFGPGDAALQAAVLERKPRRAKRPRLRPDLPRPPDQPDPDGDPRPGQAAHAALESASLTDRARARLRSRGAARG